MLTSGEKLGAFIIPTGIGANIGGFAGDASPYARLFANNAKLIVNPNVVNAGCFSGITDNMFYVEGHSLNEFFKSKLHLTPTTQNKIGVVFDKAIPNNILNIHINTINAVKAVYGIDIREFIITDQEVGIDFNINGSGISTGKVNNPQTLLNASEQLLAKGCNAIALVCLFNDPENDNPDYANGEGIDPIGGTEAIISHYISKELKVPCAHAPAFVDYQIKSDLVNAKAASEYITPTFLPCILLGLSKAPQFSNNGISIKNLDYLIMPYDSLGCTPVFECLKRNIPIYAIKENTTVLNITPDKISSKINIIETYSECLNLV